MGRNIVIIDGHPDPNPLRLCHALANAYETGARAANHEVTRINIGQLDFPILRTQAEFEGGSVVPDIADAQAAIRGADHILIIYPLWLGTMPALLKAFLEQVIRPGFAFEANSKGFPGKLLKGRSARIVITMGMPGLFYRWFFGAHSLKSLERNILKFCGIGPIRETIFGMVDAGSDTKRAKWLDRVASMGRKGA